MYSLASYPVTNIWRPIREILTWSIQIWSVPSTVIASPPQIYCGLSSVMWMFCMITLLTPFTRCSPFTNHASTANTHDRLIRGNIDSLESRLVVSASRSWVASAPGGRVQVDRILTGTATLVGRRDAAFADGALALVV